MRIITLAGYLLLASVLPLSAIGDEIRLADDAPAIYLVKEGDTLWGIANLFLRDPWMWPQSWDVNPQLENPHLIFPGDQLYLVYVDGQPRLRVRRGQQSRTVKLTPKMRIEPFDSAIPVIPLADIGAWLAQNRVVEPAALDAAPYVIAGDKRHLLSSAGDRLYAHGQFPEDETGFGIYRGGEVYIDPISQEVLGYEARDIGSARLVEHHEQEIALLEVTRITEEVRNGDRLLPNEFRRIAASFQPHVADEELNGLMIAVDSGVSQIGTLAIVVINKGARENVSIGQVMAIYQTGEIVRDEIRNENIQMPDSRAGLLMVFRVFKKMSYGIVLKSSRPLAIMDRVGNP